MAEDPYNPERERWPSEPGPLRRYAGPPRDIPGGGRYRVTIPDVILDPGWPDASAIIEPGTTVTLTRPPGYEPNPDDWRRAMEHVRGSAQAIVDMAETELAALDRTPRCDVCGLMVQLFDDQHFPHEPGCHREIDTIGNLVCVCDRTVHADCCPCNEESDDG